MRDKVFLPNALEHIGHKRILLNALKECVVVQDEHDGWKEVLNALLGVLGKNEHRKRYVARCLADVSDLKVAIVNKINSSFLDWKWEFVEELLFWVVLALPEAFIANTSYFLRAPCAISRPSPRESSVAPPRGPGPGRCAGPRATQRPPGTDGAVPAVMDPEMGRLKHQDRK